MTRSLPIGKSHHTLSLSTTLAAHGNDRCPWTPPPSTLHQTAHSGRHHGYHHRHTMWLSAHYINNLLCCLDKPPPSSPSLTYSVTNTFHHPHQAYTLHDLCSASHRERGHKTHPIKPLARTSHRQILGQTAKTNHHSVTQTLAPLLPVTMFVFWGIALIGFHASVYRVPINALCLTSYIRPCIAFKA